MRLTPQEIEELSLKAYKAGPTGDVPVPREQFDELLQNYIDTVIEPDYSDINDE